MYYIEPQGTPNHTSPLTARCTGVSSFPYLSDGLTIEWVQNGYVIKSGQTDDPSMQRINTDNEGDIAFDATDSWSDIYYVINGGIFADVVRLSNNHPTLSADVVKDSYGVSATRPVFIWTFADADQDPQFQYRVKIGSTPGGSNLHDSGIVYDTAQTYSVPDSATALVQGTTFYWTIEVSDGEKVDPTYGSDDPATDRVLTTVTGSGVVNYPPVVSNVKIDGLQDGSEVPNYNPIISWSYLDVDGQAQQGFEVTVASDQLFSNVLWLYVGTGAQTQVTYNFNKTGEELDSHTPYYVSVVVRDTHEESNTAQEIFSVAHRPVITVVLVDEKINPTNIKNQNPTFTWSVHDEDGDPITGYEIRVSDDDTELGTDSFIGRIWSPGFITTRESFETMMTQEAGAFPGCVFPKEIQIGVTYYFQVMVRNGITQPAYSVWFIGYFKLNNAPTAENLLIIPSYPFSSDDLESTWDFVDDPGETESDKTEIKWYKDDVEQTHLANQKVIPSSETNPLEVWHFTVSPHDGIQWSESVYVSPTVTIENRLPSVLNLTVRPASPKTDDALEAVFSVSDPDEDVVSVSISWFKNGVLQPALSNKRIVPPFLTSVDDVWNFSVQASDPYASTAEIFSNSVTINNSKPEINAFTVNNEILPVQLKDSNPTFSWIYSDADLHPQEAYQLVVGTSLLKTRSANASGASGATPKTFFCTDRKDGILSIAGGGDVVAGDEVFDSGVIQSSNDNHRYATDDYLPSFSISAPDVVQMTGYRLRSDARTIELSGVTGTVRFKFPGLAGTYEAEISYVDGEGKSSKYELIVDDVKIDEFSSVGRAGLDTHKFSATNFSSASKVVIRGSGLTEGSRAAFLSISFLPVQKFELDADDLGVLSGYVSDGNGGIKLNSLAGSATLEFAYPSGEYDIELTYVTESSGNASLSVSVNSTTIDSFTFESGVRTRTRAITGVSINAGDMFKIHGARGGASSARVKKIVFKPKETLQAGAKFKDGLSYYASVRVYDGRDWSNWYTTKFTMSGWAWVSSVSNRTGWTVEARFALLEPVTSTESTGTTTASTSETASTIQTTSTCENDTFQGLRIYDGTYFGWLRLKPDKVELLVEEPLEYELDGTQMHTYRLITVGKDIMLYVDDELVIDGTGKFNQPTSRKMIEFGDIAGREQTNGSTWQSFRYSTDGAYAPNALVDYSLDELQRFADSSIGRIQAYGDKLYVSVNPDDPDMSSKVYRYEEGMPSESRSVVAITKSTTTAVIVDPNRTKNAFGSSGKLVGSNRGLQYLLSSKPFPFDDTTLMSDTPDNNGWTLDSNCSGSCVWVNSGVLGIDTTDETNDAFAKYVQNKLGDPWVDNADNNKGWTIEARVRITEDGTGGLIDKNTTFILGANDSCNPAFGISVTDFQTVKPPEDDGLNAPGILINDGRFQEIVQFFSSGVRLKYASLLGEQDLTNQFYTIRIVGKGTSIAVYSKADRDRFFKRLIFAPNGLYVKAQASGDQEKPQLAVDKMGSMHVVYQDSADGSWTINYTKTIHEELVARGSGLYTSSFAKFGKFVAARPGFGLPADKVSEEDLDDKTFFSGGASFISWGVQVGDLIVAFSKADTSITPRKFMISSVSHETILKIQTEEDLSDLYDGVEYVIMRGEETWLPPVRVSSEMLDCNNPRILLTSNIETFVAYQNYGNGNSEIYVRRGLYDPFYVTWKETVRLTNARFDSVNPDITQRPNGNLVVVWQDSRDDRNGSHIYVSEILLGEFGVLDEYQNVDATPAGILAKNPKVVALGEKVFIVYEDDPDEDENNDIYLVELNDRLQPSEPMKISSGQNSTNPCIDVVLGKDIIISWQDDINGPSEIYTLRGKEAADSLSFPTSALRITSSRGDSINPAIKADQYGNVLVVFQDDRTRSNFYDLYVSKYDSQLDEWISSYQYGLDIRVESYLTSSINPSIGVDGFGNIALTWEAIKDGESRIARAAFNNLPSMDKTVAAYFPLDNYGDISTEVRNQIRKPVGSVLPRIEVSIVINKSQSMAGNKLEEAKTVASSIISSLQAEDLFTLLAYDSKANLFSSTQSIATLANKTLATAFVSALTASGCADLNTGVSTGLTQDFSEDETSTKIMVLIDDGHPGCGVQDLSQIRSNLRSVNAENSNIKIFCFGVQGSDATFLNGIVSDSGGSATFRDDFQTLTLAFESYFESFNDNRNNARRFDFSFEEASHGTAFDKIDAYQVQAPGDLSLANPDMQRGFNLNTVEKGFSTDASLLSKSGAVDVWMKPSWSSVDITSRVIFGNAEPSTITPNTMVCGIRAAVSGNDFYLRVVDSSGIVRETYINNPDGGPNRFDWDPDDLVHIRAVWDKNAVGTSTIRAMSFPTSSTGYACTQDGSVWKTVNSGADWVRQSTNVTYELYSIDFIDATTGWACGEMGTVIKTIDGGDTWSVIDTEHENDLNGIFFRTSSIGYTVGSEGIILYSTDGGDTWVASTVVASSDFTDVSVLNNGSSVYPIAVGSDGKIYRSQDDGVSFSQISVAVTSDWKSVSRTHQAGPYITYVVGSGGSIIATSNLGANWADLHFDWGIGYQPNLYGVAHGPASNYAYVVGQNGSLSRTSNGINFERVTTAVEDGILRSIAVTANDTFVAAGTGGTVFYSSNYGGAQTYSMTRCGNLRIVINGIEPEQIRVNDGPFEWDPSAAASGLIFGDYRQNGTDSINAVIDEVVIYSSPPPSSGILKRKDFWIYQAMASGLLLESSSEKRLEWGDISPLVKTRSYWSKIELFMCGAKEPTQVFAWDSQIGFVDDMIRCMALDKSNRLWVGTENGISSLDLSSVNDDIERWLSGRPLLGGDKDRLVNYTNLADGLVADSVSSITVDSNNNIWAGTAQGLMFLDTARESSTSTGADPVDEADKDSTSTDVVNAPTTKFVTYTTEQGLPSNNILVVKSLGNSVFVGTDDGLAVISIQGTETAGSTLQGGETAGSALKIAVFNQSSGLPSNRIQAIAQEKVSGNIWIGTDRGLAQFSKQGSIIFDATTGMPNTDIASITVDEEGRKYVGTGFGITRIDGTSVDHLQPSEGVGFGAILNGDTDGSGVKWFATSDGLLELDENCDDRLVKYGLDDGFLGNPSITDYQYYRILGGDIPGGGCNKAMVNVAINGVQQSRGFTVNECVPWIIFDTPLTPSDKVDVCVDKRWRKVHDFDGDLSNPSNLASLETTSSTFYMYRRKYASGTVLLGANFAPGASNDSTAMYSVFALPIIGNDAVISAVPSPTGAQLNASVEKGVTSIYSDDEDIIQVIPSILIDSQHVALPSAYALRIDDAYLELTLSDDAIIYVAYDSRSNALPGWLRSFEPVRATFRITDMETFTDGTQQEKLFISVSGTTGCVYDLLHSPDVCDISDQIAVDSTAPVGCATITRLNASDEAVLSLEATDVVTGVEDMQVSAYENFTTDGETDVEWVPFQTTYNLPLPVEALDPVEELDATNPVEDDPQSPDQFPDLEYTIVHQHIDSVIVGTKNPGRGYLFNKSTQKISFLFDTGEDEVISMVSFGSELIIGTGINGRAFKWNGQVLTQILLPEQERVTALAAFDSRVFFGTSPYGVIYQMDQFGTIQLFMDTNETSVNGFAIAGGNLYWVTSNEQVREGDDLTLTTRIGHRHSVIVPAGADIISEVTAQSTEVDGHVHLVVLGVVQEADGHTHALNGSRSGKVFRMDSVTGLSSIVHTDKDYSITAIGSDSISSAGLMFIGTYPNGKVLRYVPEESIFIKSFDTVSDSINTIMVIDNIFYTVADDDLFFFSGRHWEFFGSVADEILDLVGIGDDLLIVRKESLGRTSQVTSSGLAPSTVSQVCAFVRFRDAAGNVTLVRDSDGNLIDCYHPCFSLDGTGNGGDPSGGGGSGGGSTNPLIQGSHRIVEVSEDGRAVFSISGPDPFMSGNRVEEEVGKYYSEVFNGTKSLIQWVSLSWIGTTQSGSSITIAVRTASTSSGIDDAEFGSEFTVSNDNDLTNLTGQFLQFRATLKVTTEGIPSPELDKVDIELRISEATHYFTTNFSLPDDLESGILAYTGCRNPPSTDIVFGISGKNSTDFSDYFIITPKKVFEVPTEHQTGNLRVGIKLISSPETVPVIDEFALLFSLANDATIRLNLPGHPTEVSPPVIYGDTRTVITEKTQGHSHSITFDSTITDQAGINGQTSINGGHSHLVVNGSVQVAAGHLHEFEI